MSKQADYLASGGTKCPNCGSQDIESQEFEFDGPSAWSFTHCHTCEAEWTEQYQLTGYANLTSKEKR